MPQPILYPCISELGFLMNVPAHMHHLAKKFQCTYCAQTIFAVKETLAQTQQLAKAHGRRVIVCCMNCADSVTANDDEIALFHLPNKEAAHALLKHAAEMN